LLYQLILESRNNRVCLKILRNIKSSFINIGKKNGKLQINQLIQWEKKQILVLKRIYRF